MQEQHGWRELIAAYCAEFAADEDVSLLFVSRDGRIDQVCTSRLLPRL